MCFGGGSPAPPPAPAPLPPPPAPPEPREIIKEVPAAPPPPPQPVARSLEAPSQTGTQLEKQQARTQEKLKQKARGTSQLRIDRADSVDPKSGTGLNIPN